MKNRQYSKAEQHFRDKRHAFKVASKACTKFHRETSDLRVSIMELEKNLPIVEIQLARIKEALPKAKTRIKILELSYEGARKRRKKAEVRLSLAVKKFAVVKKLIEINKEIENVDS